MKAHLLKRQGYIKGNSAKGGKVAKPPTAPSSLWFTACSSCEELMSGGKVWHKAVLSVRMAMKEPREWLLLKV